MNAIRNAAPVHLTFHSPRSEEETRQLARLAARVHADTVILKLKAMNCPAEQKLALLDAVIRTVRENSGPQG